MFDIEEVAAQLVSVAQLNGHAVVRCDSSTPRNDLRAHVPQSARKASVRVRTGMVGDVLAVVRADAALWAHNTATMRSELTAPTTAGVLA